MRLVLLAAFVGVLALYAWRDWYRSLCGLIVLSAVLERNDMPKNILGIQGLNPWNILLVAILVPWFLQRRAERRRWELPTHIALPLAAYLTMTCVAFARAVVDFGDFDIRHGVQFSSFLSDEIINPFKLMLVGALVFDGCRTKERCWLTIISVLLVGVLYSLLVIKTMPLGALASDNYMEKRYRIERDVGLHANDMAMVLVGTIWSLIASWQLFDRKAARAALLMGVPVALLALALCFSRAGFAACAGVGVLFGLFLSRKWLVILPVGFLGILVAFPAVANRLEMGFGDIDAAGAEAKDWDMITAGRTTKIWPSVIERIDDAPVFGHGRGEFMRPPLSRIMEAQGELHGHPHNAYLEVLLDSGLIGLAIVLTLYGSLLLGAIRSCRSRIPEMRAAGGMALATLASLMITGMSAQSFTPTVSMLTLWCTCGLMLRLRVEQRKQMYLQAPSPSPSPDWNHSSYARTAPAWTN